MLGFLFLLITGALAGWLAGKIMRGGGFGPLKNILLGVAGAFIGGILFRIVGFRPFGPIGALISATVGAVILLWIAGRLRRD